MWLRTKDSLELHDSYLAAVGRALLLAQSFEQNCKFVLLVWDLGDALKSKTISNLDDIPEYSSVLLKRFLGYIVERFGKKYGIKREQYDLLTSARDARNYIAHEAAQPCLYEQKSSAILEEIPKFKSSITSLAHGDNLVSSWSYMIQEKEPPPSWIRAHYVNEITAYILEPLDEPLQLE